MKFIISYTENDANQTALFVKTAEEMQAIFTTRKSARNEFKFDYVDGNLIAPEWSRWFAVLETAGLSLEKIALKDKNGKVLSIGHPLSVAFNSVKNEYIERKSVIAELDDSEDAKESDSEVTVTEEDDSFDSLRNDKTLKLSKFDACLTLLTDKKEVLFTLANGVETSPAFRMFRITNALHNKLAQLRHDYLTQNDMSDEHFKELAREALKTVLLEKISADSASAVVEYEEVNVRDELSQHPQWGLLSILDNLLWLLDPYRLVTGERHSFFKVFQPEVMNQVDATNEVVQRFGAVGA